MAITFAHQGTYCFNGIKSLPSGFLDSNQQGVETNTPKDIATDDALHTEELVPILRPRRAYRGCAEVYVPAKDLTAPLTDYVALFGAIAQIPREWLRLLSWPTMIDTQTDPDVHAAIVETAKR